MTCAHLFPLLKTGARIVNVSSAAGSLFNIPSEVLRQKFAGENLTLTQLDQLVQDFIASAYHGDHKAKGWPDSTYVVSKVEFPLLYIDIYYLLTFGSLRWP